MKLSALLPPQNIIVPFKIENPTPEKVITQLVREIYARSIIQESVLDPQDVLQALLEREHEQSTAVGCGYAFPHARFESMSGIHTVLAIAPEGIDFDAPDGLPCKYFLLTLVSRSQPHLLLKTRAAMIRFLSRKGILPVIESESPEAIWQRLDNSGILVNDQILAKDMMKPLLHSLRPEMTLEDSARALHRYHVDALPVLDAEGHYIREFSCHDLFAYGIPKFLSNLSDVSCVKELNPFEKYFMTDRSQQIGHLELKEHEPLIDPTATLMEIIFEMTAHDRHQLYVISDTKKVLGVIDRHTIVDKILMSYV